MSVCFFCICTSSSSCRDEELNVKGSLTQIMHIWLLLYLNFNLQSPSVSKGPLPLVLETQTGLSLTKVNKVFTTSNTQVVNFEVRCSLTKRAPSSGAATPLQAGCTCVQLCGGHKPLADVGIVSNISAVFKQCN